MSATTKPKGAKLKRCTGRCGRMLPDDDEHFHKTSRKYEGHLYEYRHAKCKRCRCEQRNERWAKLRK